MNRPNLYEGDTIIKEKLKIIQGDTKDLLKIKIDEYNREIEFILFEYNFHDKCFKTAFNFDEIKKKNKKLSGFQSCQKFFDFLKTSVKNNTIAFEKKENKIILKLLQNQVSFDLLKYNCDPKKKAEIKEEMYQDLNKDCKNNRKEIIELKENHRKEIDELKENHKKEINELNEKIDSLKKTFLEELANLEKKIENKNKNPNGTKKITDKDKSKKNNNNGFIKFRKPIENNHIKTKNNQTSTSSYRQLNDIDKSLDMNKKNGRVITPKKPRVITPKKPFIENQNGTNNSKSDKIRQISSNTRQYIEEKDDPKIINNFKKNEKENLQPNYIIGKISSTKKNDPNLKYLKKKIDDKKYSKITTSKRNIKVNPSKINNNFTDSNFYVFNKNTTPKVNRIYNGIQNYKPNNIRYITDYNDDEMEEIFNEERKTQNPDKVNSTEENLIKVDSFYNFTFKD